MRNNKKLLLKISISIFILSLQINVFGQSSKQQILELKRLKLEKKYSIIGDFDTLSLLATFVNNNKTGYIDTIGNELKINIPGKLCGCYSFRNGYAIVCTKQDGKNVFYIINKKGSVLYQINGIEGIGWGGDIDHLIVYDKQMKQGMINRYGTVIIPFKYYLLEPIGDGLLRAYIDDPFNVYTSYKMGIINYKGEEVVPPVYNGIFFYDKKTGYLLAQVGNDLIAKYQNKEYRIKNAFTHSVDVFNDAIVTFKDSIILANKHGIDVVYNLKLDTLYALTNKIDGIEFYSEGLFGVRHWLNVENNNGGGYKASGCTFSYINVKGEAIIPNFNGDGNAFCDGLSRFSLESNNKGYYGFIDKKGVVVIPCIYDRAEDFKNGYAKVGKGDKYYFINTKGQYVMDANPF